MPGNRKRKRSETIVNISIIGGSLGFALGGPAGAAVGLSIAGFIAAAATAGPASALGDPILIQGEKELNLGIQAYQDLDYGKALKHYENAIRSGGRDTIAKATRNIGLLYEFGQDKGGKGVEKTLATAARYYQEALQKGYAAAQQDLSRLNDSWGVQVYNEGKHQKALEYFTEASKEGGGESAAVATRRIGAMYTNGQGGAPKDYVIAARYYQQALEKGHAAAQQDIDDLYKLDNKTLSSIDAYNIGAMYHNADRVTRSYNYALLWFQKASENGYVQATYMAGVIYEEVEKKFVEAVRYYEQAAKNHLPAKEKLKSLHANPSIPVKDSIAIGKMYHHGATNIERNGEEAASWYEKAGSGEDLRSLGFAYEKGNLLKQDSVTAARYYKQALQKGYAAAQLDLSRLNDDWGVQAYREGKHEKALEHFIEANKEGGGSSAALATRRIGAMYTNGQGGAPKDFVIAARYYQQALEKGYATAQQDLNDLHANTTTLREANSIADMYYHGKDVKQDYAKALLWFEKARSMGDDNAIRTIGLIYESGGYGVDKDLVKAAQYYREALDKRNAQAQKDMDRLVSSLDPVLHRRELKIILRENIIARFQANPRGYLDERGAGNSTFLHVTTKNKLLKHSARLLFLGSSIDPLDGEYKVPLQKLAAADMKRVGELQTQVTSLAQLLMESPTAILVNPRHLIVKGAMLDVVEGKKTFDNLYAIEQIKPLLELAKLAALGLHKLSRRRRFTIDGYDSDGDYDEALREDQKFRMVIDATRVDVAGIAYWNEDGRGGEQAGGVFIYGYKNNVIYVGGRDSNEKPKLVDKTQKVRGVMIHELAHFVAEEVFDNDCNPYTASDGENKTLFTKITEELLIEEPKEKILQAVFNPVYYTPAQRHRELIVRVPQIIVEYGPKEGMALLRKQAPKLLKYYLEVFVPTLEAHIKLLKDHALGHWPEEMIQQVHPKGDFAFQRRPRF